MGGSDYGSDIGRDLGDGPPASWRDSAPLVLEPIDADAPVSGHVPAAGRCAVTVARPGARLGRGQGRPRARSCARPEPVGIRLADVDRSRDGPEHLEPYPAARSAMAPADLAVVYAIPASGFDVVVNGEHLVSWGVEPADVHAAAMANLARLVGRARAGPARSPASGACSPPITATDRTPRGSCCPRSAPTSPRPRSGRRPDPGRAARSPSARRRGLDRGRRRLRRSADRIRGRPRRRRRRADRPAPLRARR